MKRFFNSLDEDSKIVIACVAIAAVVVLVAIPLHGHLQMIDLFGSCGCPFCR